MLTAQQTYDRLKNHADTYGYCTLSEEERFFLKRYKAENHAGSQTTAERLARKKQRTWSGTSTRRRTTPRARTWVDPTVATWTKPAQAGPIALQEQQEVLYTLPSTYSTGLGKLRNTRAKRQKAALR